jgi:hypothetical protein
MNVNGLGFESQSLLMFVSVYSLALTFFNHHYAVTTLENLELQSLVKESCRSGTAFFDTAERYGSHLKTALGVSEKRCFFLFCVYIHIYIYHVKVSYFEIWI